MHLYVVGLAYSALVLLPVALFAYAACECCKGKTKGT